MDQKGGLCIISFAGNFFSAVFENSCIAVVGSSGGVFGMFGLFIADIVMNFESIRRYGVISMLAWKPGSRVHLLSMI